MIRLADDLYLVPDELAPGVHLLRFFPDPLKPYETVTNAIEEDHGRTVVLKGLKGAMPSREHWWAVKSAYFPLVQWVRFARRDLKTGIERWFTIDLETGKITLDEVQLELSLI